MTPVRQRFAAACAAAMTAVVAASAQSQRPATSADVPFRVERLNPGLDAVLSTDASLETLGDRFALTEGPVWVREPAGDGYLLFSDNAANVIYKWQRGRPLTVFLEKSGFTGTDISRVGAQTVAGRVPIL